MATSMLSRRRRAKPNGLNGKHIHRQDEDTPPSSELPPLVSSSKFSLFTYSWLTPIMTLGNERALSTSDLWRVDRTRSAAYLSSKIVSAWGQNEGGSLLHATNEVAGSFFWTGGACKVFADISQMMGPLLIKAIIRFAKDRSTDSPPSLTYGLFLAVSLFALVMTTSLVHHQFFWRSITTGVLARTALISSMYSRAVRNRLSNAALINHISTDVSRVEAAAQWFHPVWSAPIQVLICLAILLSHLGPSALAGFALFILIVPLHKRMLGQQFRIRKRLVKLVELRTASLLEALSSMHFIKCYTLEMSFLKRISSFRAEELTGIKRIQNAQSANSALAASLPVFSATLSFISYSRSGDFDLAVMFASLSLFQLLRQPVTFWPRALSLTTDALASLRRLSSVYYASGLPESLPVIVPDQKFALSVKSATFKWGDSDERVDTGLKLKSELQGATRTLFTLEAVNLELSRGSLVALIGPVASGKSSLLQGLIGGMRKTSGEVSFSGRVAYCQQDAWIQRGIIRDNIIFGGSFDEEKYDRVLKATCLEEDMLEFPDGDQTQVGENGFALSGGQRQRISLARALYFDGDVLLLDDPLSSVDARVGNHIFHSAILEARKAGKAILMVTYDRKILSQCDSVLYLQGGRVVGEGESLDVAGEEMQTGDLGQSYVLVWPGASSLRERQTPLIKGHMNGAANPTPRPASTRTPTKKAAPREVYRTYYHLARNFLSIPTLAFATVVMQTFQIFGSRSLMWWQSNTFHRSFGFYQTLYAALGLLQASATFFLAGTVDSISCLVSRNVHDDALKNIVLAPMSFFESTPVGAIVSLFVKDMDSVDNQLPSSVRTLCLTVATVLGSVAVIVYFQPYLSVVAVMACVGYYHFYQVCRATSKQLRRIEANLRSDLYAHITESLHGLETLRGYRQVDRSVVETNRLLDLQNRASFLVATSQRWLSVRLDFCGAVLIFSVALCAVLGVGNIGAAQIGLILTYTTTLTQMAGLLTRQISDVELQMNSIERLSYYLDPAIREASSTSSEPPVDWPQRGGISMKDVSVNYRPGSRGALHNVTLDIHPGEKIGIVGRTGAGKSTLVNCLMRIVGYSGGIEIDGVDISTIPLDALRSKLSFVPQQSVVFGGTVRSAIDPHCEFTDGTLRNALHRAFMQVSSTGGSQHSLFKESEAFSRCFDLDRTLEPGGTNLSLGERALLSLTRVLVRDSKIVILDEATASIDSKADENLQRAIHQEFKDRTLICIAHRIQTVLSYDRIVVLDGGTIVGLDTPLNLYDKNELFGVLCAGSHTTREEVVGAKWGR